MHVIVQPGESGIVTVNGLHHPQRAGTYIYKVLTYGCPPTMMYIYHILSNTRAIARPPLEIEGNQRGVRRGAAPQ
jgi:hypothetical protein